MTDYRNYSAEDFARNDFFKNWVRNPESDSSHFWSNWIEEHPEKREVMNRAKVLVLAFDDLMADNLSAQEVEQEITLLKLKASFSEKPRPIFYFPANFYRIVAAIVLVAGIAFLSYQYAFNSTTLSTVSEQVMVTEEPNKPVWINTVNNQKKPQTILLDDGSEVVLTENSSLRYLSDYQHAEERTVYLTGEAFFEVAKDSIHPFLVFAGNTVTRVLGTSFRVQSTAEKVEVRVNSGKVAVHRLQDFELHASEKSISIPGVILSPNDKAVFESARESFNTSRLHPGEETVIQRTTFETEFSDIPVTAVLDSLGRTYGVTINYDLQSLKNCHINTMFKDESLLQKVKLVCIAIGGEYHVKNGSIFIENAICN